MNNLRGALLMILAMGLFSLEDMFIKKASATLPVGQILLIVGLCGTTIFTLLALANRRPLFPRELMRPAMLLRNGGELVGTFGFVTALALTPISSASAILQALPLAVTMMAALVLGEPVGWRRWSAITVGFAGVLLIVRPGAASFEPASLFAVLGVLGLAIRDLTTRLVPPTLSTVQMAQWGFAMAIPLGAGMLLVTGGARAVPATTAGQLAGAVLIGVVAYYTIVVSLRISEISAIAPFRYSRLVFAMIIGLVVFGERPDAATLAGAALIVASGLYALARERALFSREQPG